MTKPRILYIEDYPVVQQMYLDVLSKENIQIDCVSDGEAALEAAAKHEYNLVLLDLLLPQVTGMAFLREFRKKHPETEVAVLSDFEDTATVNEVYSLGVTHYWLKVENTPHILAQKLMQVLRKQAEPKK